MDRVRRHLQGTREAILAAYAVRSDFEQALALDPGDASAHHLLGQWALRVALLGPWTRWLASTLYAEPPSATLDEAVAAFQSAEALQPGDVLQLVQGSITRNSNGSPIITASGREYSACQ